MEKKRQPVSRGVKFRIPPTISQQENEQVQREWDTYDDAVQRLEQMGVTEANAPSPIKKGELADISGTEYSERYVEYLGWATFVNQRLTESNAILLQLENEIDDVAARIRTNLDKRLKNTKEKMTVEQKKDHLQLHPMYRPLRIELQVQEQVCMLLRDRSNSAKEHLKVISRQVEIRKTEFDGQVRESNMGRGWQ